MYQRIFVTVDDSATSRYALGEALRLAKLTQATVRLVHVVDLAQFGWGGTEFLDAADLQKTIKTAGEKVLQTAVSAAEEAGVPSENGLLESWGDKIAEVLVTDAEAFHADLVVMGTHGFSGLMHLLMGSVAEGIVKKSTMPVLLVRHQQG